VIDHSESQISSTESLSGQAAIAASPVATVSEATVKDYWALLKPNVMGLVIFTGFVGIVAAPGSIHPILLLTALLCISVGAGAAGALNMWYEADIDAGMQRTRSRPIPSGRVTADEALTFGVVLSIGSVLAMAILINYVAAALLAVTIAFYVFVYTMWLKRRTPQNIVIGGAAGALPPVIGWASVTGAINLEPMVLFLIVFLWTPPHFWALALYKMSDYGKVGVPMLPVTAGKAHTRLQIVLYSLVLVPTTILPYYAGFAGQIYLLSAILSGVGLIYYALAVWWFGRLADAASEAAASDAKHRLSQADRAERGMFKYSTYYLFVLFAILLLEHGLDLVPLKFF
jgi:protoheme IX farnesyltransferase